MRKIDQLIEDQKAHGWNISARRAALKQRQKDTLNAFKERAKERQVAVKKRDEERKKREDESKRREAEKKQKDAERKRLKTEIKKEIESERQDQRQKVKGDD